jgi:hypothetical protein
MSYYNGPKAVMDGLVMYLDAGNTKSYLSGSSTWNDLSGNGNNGTLTNGPTFSSANGGSIVFDGVDDTITVPYSSTLDPTGGITIEAWIYANNITTNRYYEIYRKETGNRILFSFQELLQIIQTNGHRWQQHIQPEIKEFTETGLLLI